MSQLFETPTRPFEAGAAITQHLRVKLTAGKLAAAGIGDDDIGTICDTTFADGDKVSVRLTSAQGTRKMVAAGAVTAGARVYQAASGKVDDLGVGKCIGIAMEAAGANNDVFEVLCDQWSASPGMDMVAGGATLTLTVATHNGKTILLDTLAGSVITLPAAVGSGARFRFLVSVAPTSNFHQVKVANASDTMAGSANILDNDAAAQGAFAAIGTDDNIQLNGTTKGGLVGDWIEVVDVKTNVWAIFAQLVCPAGSNPADMFSAAV